MGPDRPLCRPPKLQPTFGCRAWSNLADCTCVHPRGPIPKGSVMCCMACHKSGVDHMVSLQIGPGDMPRPEPKPKPKEEPAQLDEHGRRRKVLKQAKRSTPSRHATAR